MRFFARFRRACAVAAIGATFGASLGGVGFAALRPGAAPARAEAATADGRFTLAQNYGAPPADVGPPGDEGYGQAAPDSSSLLVRIDRLEAQMRQLNGEIEQLQFENHKLEDQLKKFQDDVDFRFQDSGRGGAPARAPRPPSRKSAAMRSTASPLPTIRPPRRRLTMRSTARRRRPWPQRVRAGAPTPSIRPAIQMPPVRRVRLAAPIRRPLRR